MGVTLIKHTEKIYGWKTRSLFTLLFTLDQARQEPENFDKAQGVQKSVF